MKLLRDVVKARSSSVWRTTLVDDSALEEHGDDYGPPMGSTDCCGWLYSAEAYRTLRIRHMSDCENYNPNGISEY